MRQGGGIRRGLVGMLPVQGCGVLGVGPRASRRTRCSAYGHAHSYADAYGHPHAYSHADAYGHARSSAANRHAHACASRTRPTGYRYTHLHADIYGHADSHG